MRMQIRVWRLWIEGPDKEGGSPPHVAAPRGACVAEIPGAWASPEAEGLGEWFGMYIPRRV